MTSAAAETLRRSPLHDRHVAAGGRMVPFAGWEMPVQYAGVREEHLAVRRAAGMFDVSHMGQIQTRGVQAESLLQRLVTADIRRLTDGAAQYGLICRQDGGVLDDLISYRLGQGHYLTVTNAANHERDLAWFRRQASGWDAEVLDRREDYAMIAVQGPRARGILTGLADGPLPPRMHCAEQMIAGVNALVCGTGYTGEDGVELICETDRAPALWDGLLAAGVLPAGLGARDTLRTEACFPLYGNELTEARTPIAAGLGWACREETGFIGSDAVAAERADGPAERLVAFVIDGPGIARAGNPVAGGGIVTSGTYAPCLQRGAGMAYLPGGAEPGTRLQVDVRGTLRDALVVPKPLYVKES